MLSILASLILLDGLTRVRACAAACVCVFIGDARGKLEGSEAAFVGRAIAVEGLDGRVRMEGDSLPYFMKTVTFVVERGWSGAPLDTVRATIHEIGLPDAVCTEPAISDICEPAGRRLCGHRVWSNQRG